MKRCSKCGAVKPLDAFYPAAREGEVRNACRECMRSVERERQRVRRAGGSIPQPEAQPEAQPERDGKTAVVNACGHTYRYTIKRSSAVRWLETQPCPACRSRKRGDAPQPEAKPEAEAQPEAEAIEPEPEAKPEAERQPEPDREWADAIPLPDAAFHAVLPDIILATRAGIPAWLQGPPGTSKSTIAAQVAAALGLGFYPVACHEMMSRSDLFGFTDANGIDHRTPLWNGYENGGVVLLDEVDNGNPNLLAALNSALSNGHCVFGSGTVVERHADFRVIATANTAGLGPEHGFIGRNGVDLATRDRFATFMVPIDDSLEAALATLAMGEPVDAAPFLKRARQRLLKRSANPPIGAAVILENIRRARRVVEARYRGTIVSPRATLHVGALVAQRFTLDEAMATKLPGLSADDVAAVLRESSER